LSGGKDEKVLRWGADFSAPKETIKLPRNSGPFAIRSITENKDGRIALGTSNSEVFEIGTDKKPRLLVQGHGEGELWGLSAHPSKHLFATAGDDQTVRVWDIAQRSNVSLGELSASARSVDFSPDGKKIAVGLANGSV
jgi:WD40 repeat protein